MKSNQLFKYLAVATVASVLVFSFLPATRVNKSDSLQVTLEPVAADGVFPAGRDIEVQIKLSNPTGEEIKGTIESEWTTDSCEMPRVLAHSLAKPFVIPSGQSMSTNQAYRPDGPGLYPVNVTVKYERGTQVHTKLILGYDVEHIQGPATRPPNFDAFWAARLRDLASVKPDYVVDPKPDRSTAKVDSYFVTMRSYGGVRIHGWLTIPKGKGPWPGLLNVSGYGGTETTRPATQQVNMVVMQLSVRGQGDSKEDIDPMGKEYMYCGLTGNPADYIYVGAYLDVVRAVDLLCSQPEVDPKRIGIAGGSQGGGLSLAGAALDSRIVACAPSVPWLLDWPDYAVTAPWASENFPKFLNERMDLSQEKLLSILSYVDAMNLADRIRCPVTVSLGLMDDIAPPRTIMATYNRITSPKTIRYYPHGGHGGGETQEKTIRDRWLTELLGAVNR